MARAPATVTEIFCGAGLLGAAFSDGPYELVDALDLDADAIFSYQRNVSPLARLGNAEDLSAAKPSQILLAGPPCQGFSTLGHRDPRDERNAMSAWVPKWANATGAEAIVVENVPPFLRSAHWCQMEHDLKSLGFTVDTWELDAADFGALQRRRRAFTIAVRGLPKVERPEAKPHDWQACAPAFENLTADDPMHDWPTPSALAVARMEVITPGGDKRDVMRRAPRMCPPSWSRIGCQATDAWGRVRTQEPANTLKCRFQNPSLGRYIHPVANRVISLREGARLQGVPDHWLFVGNRTSVARQIGNGVPLPLGRAIAQSIEAIL